jgi:putative hydrolase of the HAD superfamily
VTGVRDRPRALLIDLDGVLRVFDPRVVSAIEHKHGLPAGALMTSAMAWHRLRPTIAGEQSHEAWVQSIVDDLPGGADAVHEWQAYRGDVVPEVLGFVREVRAARIPVGLATNATSWLDRDLRGLRLDREFDAVVNSSVVGVHKPAREFFEAACRAVATLPAQCLYVDDDDRAVRGARVVGLAAYRWNGPADLPYLRAALGLAATPDQG